MGCIFDGFRFHVAVADGCSRWCWADVRFPFGGSHEEATGREAVVSIAPLSTTALGSSGDVWTRRPGGGGWLLSGEWSRFGVVGDGVRAGRGYGRLSW